MLTGLVDLISSNPDFTDTTSGLYPMLLPEGTSLGTTWRVVGGSSDPTFTTSGPQRLRIEFDCYATSYAAADALRSVIRTILDGYQGLLSDGTFLQNCIFIQPIDHPYDYQPRLYRLGAEYYLFFNLTS
jgi:hypothetical protein